MKRLDIGVIAAALILCGLSALFFNRHGPDNGTLKAEIYVAGALTQTLSLNDPQQLWVGDGDGKVLLLAEPDGVSVIEAHCPSQDCVRTGKITASGEMIACLPGRIVIKLTGGHSREGEVDAVAR